MDEDSVLNYYKKLIAFRKGIYKDVLVDGIYERMDSYEVSTDMYVYRKYDENNEIIVILNLGDKELKYDLSLVESKEILLSNYGEIDKILRPYEAIVIRR